MFERFTDRARKVMALANQEAIRFNHEHLGTEHILLGLVKEGTGVGANVLMNLGVDLRKVRLEVEKLVAGGTEVVPQMKLPQSPRAKRVVEYAIAEARDLNHNYVGSEHLLLGLLRETDGLAAQALMNLNLSLEDTRSEIIDLLGRGEPDPNDDPVSSGGVEDVEWQPRSPKVLLWLAEQVVLGVGEHKDLSVREANYEKAAELRDLQEKLKRLFDELRRILDEGHADEQWPTGTEGGD